MYCVILQTTKVFFIFASIQKPTNTLNLLTNSIYKIYIFYFSYIFCFIVNLFLLANKYLAAQAAENHGDEGVLLMRDVVLFNFNQNPLTKFTSSSRNSEFKDILPWNIFQMITKTVPISTRIFISNAMKWNISL